MSEYTRFRYESDARLGVEELAAAAGLTRLVAAVMAGGGVAAGGLVVAAGRAGAGTVAAMHREVTARAEAIQRSRPDTEAYLDSLRTSPLLAAAVLRAAGSDDPSGLRRLSPDQIRGLIDRGKNELLQDQARLLRHKVAGVFAEMGYEVRRPRLPQRGAVLLRGVHSAGQGITVAIRPESDRLEIDLAGFGPGQCRRAREEFVDRLARRGVRLGLEEHESHRRRRGGRLVELLDRVLSGEEHRIPAGDTRTPRARQETVRQPHQQGQ
ncbi:MAG TPA: hypothetical protein ENK27_06600 [Desulfobulbus sp.]|nr:hypothetical protein [Desulfobulbus sp.]